MTSQTSSNEEASLLHYDYEEHQEEKICQICLLPKQLVITPCQHTACISCFEHVLLATCNPPNFRTSVNNTENTKEFQEDTIIAACPTRGRCPFCRRSLDMFQLKYETTRECVYSNTVKLDENSLAGLVFVNTNKMIGDHSVHFPVARENGSGTQEMPFLSFEECKDETLDNGCSLPKQKMLQHGFHFHKKSKTFSGTINWTEGPNGSTWNGSDRWEVIMQFSSDLVHVLNGAIIKHRSNNNNNDYQEACPLDGWWEVRQRLTRRQRTVDLEEDDDNNGYALVGRIQVVGNSYYLRGKRYVINLQGDDDGRPNITWSGIKKPCGGVYQQVVETGIDLQRKKDGPDVGDHIVWTIDHPDYHRILWIRQSKCFTSIERFGLEHPDFITYRQHKTMTHSSKPTYNRENLWGNVFIQCLKVGVASYHFVSAEDEGVNGVYISYEHRDCGLWGLLDDGSAVPSRVPFVNHTFDKENRIFRGSIPWMDAYNTCWRGHKVWHYEIVFDQEFLCIKSGSVVMERMDGEEDVKHYFGESLIYLNAALVEKIEEEVDIIIQQEDERNNGSNNNNDSSTKRVKEKIKLSRNTVNRLHEEGTSTRTINEIQSVFLKILQPGQDPIDYNLS